MAKCNDAVRKCNKEVFVFVFRALCTHSRYHCHTAITVKSSESEPLAHNFLLAADLFGSNVSVAEKFQ